MVQFYMLHKKETLSKNNKSNAQTNSVDSRLKILL